MSIQWQSFYTMEYKLCNPELIRCLIMKTVRRASERMEPKVGVNPNNLELVGLLSREGPLE